MNQCDYLRFRLSCMDLTRSFVFLSLGRFVVEFCIALNPISKLSLEFLKPVTAAAAEAAGAPVTIAYEKQIIEKIYLLIFNVSFFFFFFCS